MPIHLRTAVALVATLLVCVAVAPASAGQGGPGDRRQLRQHPPATPTSIQTARPPVTPTVTTTGPEAWAWPLSPPHPVLRAFRAPVSEFAGGHRGIDVAAQTGDPIYAVADGTVTVAGIVVDRPVISLSHVGGLVSSMEPVTALVAAGDSVRRGQLVGRVATGGHCGDGCVHLGARSRGRYVSPMRYLGGVPHAVLLPSESAALLRQRQDSRRRSGEQELWRALLREDGHEEDGRLEDEPRESRGGQARG